MIDGQFPAYEKVIPKGNDKHIDFERDRLTSAVKRVAMLSNERSRALKFIIDKGQGRRHDEQPRVRRGARAAHRRLHAAPHAICFNAQYVLDFLNVVDASRWSASTFKDDVSQAVMKRRWRPKATSYTYVIMPMRV
jgi:DNA polymerase-3 subunit beta